MNRRLVLFAAALFVIGLTNAAEYDLGKLAKTDKLELFNRSLQQPKADSPDTIYLNAAEGDGLAWIAGMSFSEGTIECEIRGKNEQGKSFVGVAFHGQDNEKFEGVYLRPFNFQSKEPERQSHSIQYISMPEYDWKKLRDSHPGEYEFRITPAPDPDSWVKLKLVIEGKDVAAFVNGSDKPALKVALLSNRLEGKLGLWVGNGSDGRFRNLKIIPATK
jgi:hypothetical protein